MSVQDPSYDDFRRMLEESAERDRARVGKCGHFEPIPPEQMPCRDEQHYPPQHIHIPYGMRYVHQCPRCHARTVLQAPLVTL